ncbi:MAG: response regulator transcription factor [Gammaproteobacteria bacterium]|jgi:two-component system invasion response regulator UvrY|nr:response regulator transcription factor [Gammaproteobacteria bacterium]
MSGKLGILLVDDHTIVRRGFAAFIAQAPDLELVAETGNGETAIKLAQAHQQALVVVDLGLPGLSGIETIRRILQRQPEARILAFSQHQDSVFIGQALQAGALGFVSKGASPELLQQALRALGRGETFIEEHVAERLSLGMRRRSDSPLQALSTREFEVFCLLAAGQTVVAAARQLALSPKTIANYTTQIKLKLQVDSLAELAHLAIRHGLLSA